MKRGDFGQALGIPLLQWRGTMRSTPPSMELWSRNKGNFEPEFVEFVEQRVVSGDNPFE